KRKYCRTAKINIFVLLTLWIFSGNCSAQTKYDFPQFWHETGSFFSMPAHWDAMDWGTLALLSGLTAVAMEGEISVRDVKFIDRDFYYSPEAVGGRMYGELYTPFILFAGYGGYSLIAKDHTARKIAYEIGQSCLYAGAIVIVMKTIVGRARPYANEGKLSFHFFSGLFDDDHHSFPSGHTTEAFTMSTILSLNAHPTWLKILAYVPALFTPFSRAYQGFHWISDCFFGAGLGYFIGKWAYDLHSRNEAAATTASSAQQKVSQIPTIYPISFTYRF
ncbi:MAG: phosphatase PAP2 family protein, partial [Bacteroidota bacterium]|nr:phosphatase PAP2 family protein [Bacteroidota bacterium]